MAHTVHSMDLKGKKIVNIQNGKVVAEVSDVLYDPDMHDIAALVTAKAGIFKRTTEVVMKKDIQVFGEDVILANGAEIVVDKAELTGADKWMQVSDQLKGITVITTEGTRIGRLQDLVIDEKGKVISLSVAAGQPGSNKMEEIRESNIRSIGRDAIIVEPGMAAETEGFIPEQAPAYEPHEETGGASDYEASPEPVDEMDLHREEHEG